MSVVGPGRGDALKVPFNLLEEQYGRAGGAAQTLAGNDVGAYLPIMLDWTECNAVERVPNRVSGAWLFKGTRVPVKALFENLEGGARVDDFLEWFPGVTREQVEAVLEHTERSLAVA